MRPVEDSLQQFFFAPSPVQLKRNIVIVFVFETGRNCMHLLHTLLDALYTVLT